MMLSGWEYICSAYAVTWAAILLYALSLHRRHVRQSEWGAGPLAPAASRTPPEAGSGRETPD